MCEQRPYPVWFSCRAGAKATLYSVIISPYIREIQRVLDSGFHTVDSESQVLDSGFFIIGTWNSGFQSLVGFRIP